MFLETEDLIENEVIDIDGFILNLYSLFIVNYKLKNRNAPLYR